MADLERHPKVGASWEGFAMQQVTARLGVDPAHCFFWATHAGAELDLLVARGQRRLGFEFKRTSTPRRQKSMHVAIADLGLERLDVVYPGAETFRLGERMRAVGLSRLLTDIAPLD
jgi:predicted AAA+ superfamily ATPase